MELQDRGLSASISSENIVPYAPLNPGEAFVVAPYRGEFYNRPDPSRQPFVATNQEVPRGMVIGLMERVKVFEEVLAPTRSRILDLEANATMVRAGQPIARIALVTVNQ